MGKSPGVPRREGMDLSPLSSPWQQVPNKSCTLGAEKQGGVWGFPSWVYPSALISSILLLCVPGSS